MEENNLSFDQDSMKENSEDFSNYRVVVVGLGYVGLTLVGHLVSRGFRVHGVEKNEKIIRFLSEGRLHFHEPGLVEILNNFRLSGAFTFASTARRVSEQRSVFILTVGTPIYENRNVNLEFIISAANEVAAILENGDLVLLRSTVRIGTTDEIVHPILQATNKTFGLAFCPERTLEGNALAELSSLPQIIGANDPRTQRLAANFFSLLTDSVIITRDTRTAEVIKLVDNMQRDAIFAISNHVAELCNYTGVRAKDVINLGKLGYRRTNLPSAGPVGGPCLSKDSIILDDSLPEDSSRLSITARNTNEKLIESGVLFVTQLVERRKSYQPKKISVLGLAFKGMPETDDLRGSPSLTLIQLLEKYFANSVISAWDPIVKSDNREVPFIEDDLDVCLQGSEIVFFVNNHPFFRTISKESFANLVCEDAIVYDFWDRFDNFNVQKKSIHYFGWGKHFADAK